MSKGVNKVILIGNLGAEPEIKYMTNGSAVANITIATSEAWKDKQTGEQHDKTEWHRVVFFNRLAEIAGEYLHKGSKIYIEGKLQTKKWKDKDGQDRYTTEIIASDMQMLGSRDVGMESKPLHQQKQTDSSHLLSNSNIDEPDLNDDIPF